MEVKQPRNFNSSPIVDRYKEFLDRYDANRDLKFSDLKYRQGAVITCSFGLTDGYKLVDGKWEWGYVRIHSGVDRAANHNSRGQEIDNVVISPFFFNRSEFHDYGKDHVYGSLVRLFSDDYKFEMRIVHMDPKESFDKTTLKLLKQGKPIERNTLIGQAGNYGQSDGAHTHTEFISYNLSNNIFDRILLLKFGNKSSKSMNTEEVIEYYKKQSAFKTASNKEIIEDYYQQLEKRRIKYILNPYKYQYKDWFYGYKVVTRYSSEYLFNGL